MLFESKTYPIGARVIIRDAEWRITEVDQTARAGVRLKCVGLSELVRGKVGVFFDRYEDDIEILLPEETRLLEDHSPNFQKSKLYLEALFRKAPKTDPTKIEVADRAAMDPLPYQFNPALQALSQPRARILIADAVGIGKTLEAGILTSELIARGRGRRILVLATKAMLTQFQQEFWNRFSIPLVRLDSAGIQRIRNRIPPNHNPFLYFDRSIISIDTLKQDLEYRDYLEHAYWDIIIIDEAHNVAQRNNRSQRARLAQLLAGRSDTMIMLSATPHDGSPESFASLMNILDPTAISNPSEYKLDDFADKGLVIRRFKSDIRNQVNKEFPDREIATIEVPASAKEEAVFATLRNLTFKTLDSAKATGARLFATTLTKAFFSSPAACATVIRHRVKKLETSKNPEAHDDIEKLNALLPLVEAVTPEHFAKFNRLAELLKDGSVFDWNRNDPEDRLVIFTESIETLDFLVKYLPKKLGLKDNQFVTLKGTMKDEDIAKTVNDFNRRDNAVRLLLCSDVASEGINLHHLAHRMIHFDVPWSLLTFQQRNGRIDRYGQTKVPQIRYLQTTAQDDKTLGDARVLQRLIEKDTQAQKNLSDPAEFMLSEDEQVDRTAAEMEGHADIADTPSLDDVLSFFSQAPEPGASQSTAIAPVLSETEFREHLAQHVSLFKGDMDYAKAMLRRMADTGDLRGTDVTLAEDHRILLGIPKDLEARLKYLPTEILPEDHRFDLTDDVAVVQAEMARARTMGDDWPHKTLLWPLHPVMKWLEDRAADLFGRHAAPLLRLTTLPQGERWALLQGGYPNRRGYIPVFEWIAVREKNGVCEKKTLGDLITALNLDRDLSNRTGGTDTEEPDCRAEFTDFVKTAVTIARQTLAASRNRFDSEEKTQLNEALQKLAALKEKHLTQLTIDFGETPEAVNKSRAENRRTAIERRFKDAQDYIVNTATTEDEAFLQLVAVFSGMND